MLTNYIVTKYADDVHEYVHVLWDNENMCTCTCIYIQYSNNHILKIEPIIVTIRIYKVYTYNNTYTITHVQSPYNKYN